MNKVFNMQEMRYINLFEKITGVRPSNSFIYNGTLIFIVPRMFVSKAIGENGKNVRKLHSILNKKVKVLPKVQNKKEIEEFITEIIHPAQFNSFEMTESEIVIGASRQSKSLLIGRDKKRLAELQKISHDYLGKSIRLV